MWNVGEISRGEKKKPVNHKAEEGHQNGPCFAVIT